ncbi:hypothetical protein KSX_65010 [Ktedonospora formicarum]|uniref:Uncharacterized protein n=1 Tax=Ktedonospora formicarum TaxID=2778364 RepID=A0A8J3I750_9CHLR|nr:hypothetical protein KSX_65010 [Ktedonospora formicarum]
MQLAVRKQGIILFALFVLLILVLAGILVFSASLEGWFVFSLGHPNAIYPHGINPSVAPGMSVAYGPHVIYPRT